MSGYRRVNYYELCRLCCVSSEGTKIHIFREEGRRRQLSSKIQTCLMLEVNERDSLPKIICNQCVEQLESFYDFRSSCVNAEAMLYRCFTTSRYSPDFIREGKVYVKDKSPLRKNIQGESENPSIKVPKIHTLPMSIDSLNSLVQAGSIEIISAAEPEGSRLPQYKCTLEVQPSSVAQVVEEPTVRYSYQTCTSMAPTTPTSTNVTLLKTEDSTQTEQLNKMDTIQNHEPMEDQGATYFVRVPTTVEQGSSPGKHEGSEVVEGEGLHQTITFTPNHTQDMLVHFGFNNKDNKDQNDTAAIIRTDERESITQIGEFLQMKTVVVEDKPDAHDGHHEAASSCDQCGKQLNTEEQQIEMSDNTEQANHAMSCSGSPDKDIGHYPCDVCGKPFKRKEHLFQHRKLHTGERPYSCLICSKSFSRKEHLVRHSVSHTGQKVHACDMCSKAFSRKDNLHKHRKTHKIAGPYVCETCGKSFVVKHYYIQHKSTHLLADYTADPLPYRCDICYKDFSTKQFLISHKLRHRSKTGPNPDSTTNSEQQSHSKTEAEPQEPITLSTVNTAAILPPNVIHHGSNSPLFQVTSGTNTTYLTTTATSQLIENYRRLQS